MQTKSLNIILENPLAWYWTEYTGAEKQAEPKASHFAHPKMTEPTPRDQNDHSQSSSKFSHGAPHFLAAAHVPDTVRWEAGPEWDGQGQPVVGPCHLQMFGSIIGEDFGSVCSPALTSQKAAGHQSSNLGGAQRFSKRYTGMSKFKGIHFQIINFYAHSSYNWVEVAWK